MEAAKAGRNRLSPRHPLAGLEAGVLGALAMLGYFALASLWHHRSIWLVPNLFATTFFGNDAYVNGFGHGSLAGSSLFIALYGLLGAVWGCWWRDTRRQWLTLYGAVTGIVVYVIFFHFVWKHANPLITLYAPDRQLEVAHLVWGMLLARSPSFSRRIADQVAPEQPQALAGELLSPQI